jgi:hypothetical protein
MDRLFRERLQGKEEAKLAEVLADSCRAYEELRKVGDLARNLWNEFCDTRTCH